jgi:hypothetical protein
MTDPSYFDLCAGTEEIVEIVSPLNVHAQLRDQARRGGPGLCQAGRSAAIRTRRPWRKNRPALFTAV